MDNAEAVNQQLGSSIAAEFGLFIMNLPEFEDSHTSSSCFEDSLSFLGKILESEDSILRSSNGN
jgi:hypothetical protein